MATRFNDPRQDDPVYMNKEIYKESDYTGPEAKESVKIETNNQTEKAVSAIPSTDKLEVTGAPDETNPKELQENLILATSSSSDKDEKNKLEYIQNNNPEYFEEIGMDPDDAFTSLSGVTSDYEEVEEDTTIVDYGGYTYSETNQNVEELVRPVEILKITNEGFCHPTNHVGPVTSPFGFRILNDPGPWEFHGGVDIGCPIGTKVYAIADGIISEAHNGYGNEKKENVKSRGGYGNSVRLIITVSGYKYECIYAHLSDVYVKVGEVKRGTCLGISGNSGISGGEHLHFEIRDVARRCITAKMQNFSKGYKKRKPNGCTTNAFYGVKKTGDYIVNLTTYFVDPKVFGIPSGSI
jgi:murein DD-endopeptidase MepM/ murein hydrolase activator NlpD